MFRKFKITVFSALSAFALAACAGPEMLYTKYSAMSATGLWLEHSINNDPMALMVIEAELGSRGVSENGSRYIGQRTAGAYQQNIYPRTPSGVPDMNCSDFVSDAAAQQFFLRNGGPREDRHGLDGDGDGFACEWGRQVSQWGAAGARRVASEQAAISRPQNTYRPRCYVGPRGGTYTITASGNRNYDGC